SAALPSRSSVCNSPTCWKRTCCIDPPSGRPRRGDRRRRSMGTETSTLDRKALDRLVQAIEHDVAREVYGGAVVLLAHQGSVVLHEAIGFAERASGRRARKDDVFCLFSLTKALTAVTVLARIDRGEIALTTPVGEIIPEF